MTFSPGDVVVVFPNANQQGYEPFSAKVVRTWGRIVATTPPDDSGLTEWQSYADEVKPADTASSASRQHFIDTGRYLTAEEVAEFATDYEVDATELRRLAQLAQEYSYSHNDARDLAHYADGVRDALRYLAGESMEAEPTFRNVLEINPALTPRLVS
jgi:hypothetical protein